MFVNSLFGTKLIAFWYSADVVDPSKITAGIRRKNDYAARVEKIKVFYSPSQKDMLLTHCIQAGREGREFGSKKGQNDRTSLTNKVKSKRNKAFMMIVHKRDVKSKAKRSLQEKQVGLST